LRKYFHTVCGYEVQELGQRNLQDRRNIEDAENNLDTIRNITKYNDIHDSEIL
jgi:hypothetical protein